MYKADLTPVMVPALSPILTSMCSISEITRSSANSSDLASGSASGRILIVDGVGAKERRRDGGWRLEAKGRRWKSSMEISSGSFKSLSNKASLSTINIFTKQADILLIGQPGNSWPRSNALDDSMEIVCKAMRSYSNYTERMCEKGQLFL